MKLAIGIMKLEATPDLVLFNFFQYYQHDSRVKSELDATLSKLVTCLCRTLKFCVLLDLRDMSNSC